MKIVVLESMGISEIKWKECITPLEDAGHEICLYDRDNSEEIQMERAKDADVIIVANMPLSGKVIKGCPNLKFIDVAFTGVDHIDLKAARECGVAVSNASGYSTQAVAELAIGMMLSLLRNMREMETQCRKGATKDGLIGTELRGKTVGLLGFGAIANLVAKKLRCFGVKMLAYDLYPNEERGKALGVKMTTQEEVIQNSDIVSIHIPATPETYHLFDRNKIAEMKDGAVLINPARGALVDLDALAEALQSGKLSGAALDVFEVEPLPKNAEILKCKNVILTPHTGGETREAYHNLSMATAKDIIKVLEGGERRTNETFNR